MTTVMAGALRDFDVPSILQAVSLSRQYTVLRLWDRSKRDTGEIRLKAGQLLGAACGEEEGRAAFHAILRSKEHHSFRVDRLDDSLTLPEPVGPVASLLLSASSPEPAPAPAPPMRAVPERPRMAAATSAPAARPVAPPTGAARVASPQPAVQSVVRGSSAPTRVQSATAGSALDQVATSIGPLDGLLLAKMPDCLLCRSWRCGDAGIAPEIMASYVAQVVQAHRHCLQTFLPGSGDPVVTLELPLGTIMTQPISNELLAVYQFQPSTPLGLVRILVSQFHPEISRIAQQELFEGN